MCSEFVTPQLSCLQPETTQHPQI